jgi:hypothetical protein
MCIIGIDAMHMPAFQGMPCAPTALNGTNTLGDYRSRATCTRSISVVQIGD